MKTNKSDYIDAEAIAEAVTRPSMRLVPIKSKEQLDMQSLRARERWVMRRTAVVNQGSLLLERGTSTQANRVLEFAAESGRLGSPARNLDLNAPYIRSHA